VEKQLPQNIEAEFGVLGSIIIDPEAIIQVADFLHGEDFYRDANRTIYETIIQLYEQRIPADFITICDVLERQNRLEEVGGPGYITALINQVPTSGNVEYYGHIVERNAIMRRLAHAAGEIAAIAYSDAEAEEALDKAEQTIFTISQNHTHSDFAPIRDLMADYMTKLDQLHERRGTIVGVPTGFTDLDRLTGGLQRSDLIILAARPAVGKCLTASTLIDDPATGERLTIEECVKRRLPTVYGISEDGKIRPTQISDWIDSGIQPCYRVQTHSGRIVEVTGHHPFLTVNGWTPLHDLQVGQHIAVPTSVPAFGTDESWSLDKVRLLAYLIAEGGLTSHSPAFTNIDPIILADFKYIIATHFPECSLRQERITYTIAQKKDPYTQKGIAILPTNPVTAWLRELGLMGKLAKDKFFPACIWKWSRRYLAEFLRVLMSCDGSIYSAQGCPRIEFGVASPQLAADVYHAFIRFGIIAKYYKSSPNAWRVAITNPESIKRYQDEIGWIGEKSNRFADYQHVISQRLGNLGHAPQEIWQIVHNGAKQEGISLIELARRCGETTAYGKYAGYNAHSERSIPRYRLAAYAEVLDDPSLRRAASQDIYWDKIISIELIGNHQVYDLTVPDGANFIAQDIFVHNTSMALSLAHNSAMKHGQSIAVFSLEMSKEQLVQRLLSMDASIDQQRLRTGWIEDDEWDRIIIAMEGLSQANIWIDDTASISTTEMRSKARRLQAEHGVDLIIVDYLQLMQSTIGNKRNENRVQEVSEISRSLKGLARELNVPVLALAQLSRTVESRQSKVPQLSDLRESGSIEQDADIVMFIYRDDVYNPDSERKNIADIIVAKHRNGPVGEVSLYFQASQTRFHDLEATPPTE
jgi:replicative DNA helicase